jgi:PTH2 family peptidyl-tRNA hydrolase
MQEWTNGKFAKICCGVKTEDELLAIYALAQAKGVPCAIIVDSGFTEFDGVPTYTAVAIGPDLVDKIDEITGGLELL